MECKEVFQESPEIDRLSVQNRLLKAYEQPIYERLVAGRSNLKLLDVGCNDGSKTADRFTCESIVRVIGLECHDGLVAQAQKVYGNDGFTFYQCDVERPDFAERLACFMAENNIAAFDIIHISFVLLHLKDPGALLELLRGFLAPNGRLIVVEADDSANVVYPDTNHLFQHFLEILCLDPFAGDRYCGGKIPPLLEKSGYKQITLEKAMIRANESETQKKKDIFDTFCSYLPQDLLFLRSQEPDNTQYAASAAWLEQHYETLQKLILEGNTWISIGISVISCFGESE